MADRARSREAGKRQGPQPSQKDQLFFAAVAAAQLPMVIADPNLPDLPVVFANQAFAELTGYPLGEVMGRNCRFLQGAATDPAARAAIRQALAEHTRLAIELRNYRRNGTAFWNALFLSPVFDAAGELRYFFATQLDVTERRAAEAMQHQAQQLQAVGELTGGIAHDFNNLLTVLVGGFDALSRDLPPERRQRSLAHTQQALERARRLTGQLLAFASRQQLHPQVAEMNALVGGFQEVAQQSLGPATTLALELAPGFCHLRVDPAQLKAALTALLLNARDAMPQGGQVVLRTRWDVVAAHTPALSGLPPGRYCALEVADTGHGMTPEVLRRAAEPFFTTRFGQAGHFQAGLGLGLAGVYGFMRQSNGYLVLESEPGQGSRVRLLFPAEPNPEAAKAKR